MVLKSPVVALLLTNHSLNKAVPVVENWADIEQIATDELERAFYGHATVAEAMHAAMRRTEEYFNITGAR